MNNDHNLNLYIEKSRFTQFQGINRIDVTDSYGVSWQVNIFDSYSINIVDGKLDTNIDVFFVGHHNTYNELVDYEHLLGKRLVYVRQHSKSANLATYNKHITDKNFKPLSVYKLPKNHDISQYCFKDGEYYLKMEYGARSLNQFIVNSEIMSIAYFIAELYQLNVITDQHVKAEKISELVKESDGKVKHIKGNERELNEHAKYNYDFLLHERMNDIILELRYIQSGFGRSSVLLKRERNSTNDGIVDNEINYTDEFSVTDIVKYNLETNFIDSIIKSCSEAFKKANFFHGSIDLVIDKDHKWSIIETSNQFGTADIPYNIKHKLLSDAVVNIIDKVYNSEKFD